MKEAQSFKPAVIRFATSITEHDGRTVLMIPGRYYQELASLVKIEGTINGHPFRARVDDDQRGLYIRVNSAMLRGARAQVGDTVTLALLGPEPEPLPPKELQREFDQSPEATDTWNGLSELGKRDWIRWIEDAKKVETRMKRIARTVEQLSNGKRRACCVDVNGFMMCRIKEDDAERSV